ncbi:MAG: hypothetical protein JWM78_3423 [Verrucomicrobiaceae bacterium]|nr:hypothetical protein [Verrucomicrobiaceae bacterium]
MATARQLTKIEEDHFKKFKQALAVTVLTSTPGGRQSYERIQAERIECAKLAMQALVGRAPVSGVISASDISAAAMSIANTLVNEFVKENLI